MLHENLGQKAKTFQQKLSFEGLGLDVVKLDMPRTVCAHEDCVTYKTHGPNQVQSIHYPQHCHVECYLSSVKPEVIGDPDLMGE